jgi:hypothetical protein
VLWPAVASASELLSVAVLESEAVVVTVDASVPEATRPAAPRVSVEASSEVEESLLDSDVANDVENDVATLAAPT